MWTFRNKRTIRVTGVVKAVERDERGKPERAVVVGNDGKRWLISDRGLGGELWIAPRSTEGHGNGISE